MTNCSEDLLQDTETGGSEESWTGEQSSR